MLKIVQKASEKRALKTQKKNWLDKFDIKVQNLYINEHIEKQYQDRLFAATSNMPLTITNEMTLLIQRQKNGLEIKEIKGCIKLENGLYLIVNTYLKKNSKDISMKGLTILTKKQLNLSRNFKNGNHLETPVKIKVSGTLKGEMYFDYSKYEDIYKNLEWDETQVVSTLNG
jgi:hypothetical protein